MWCGWYTLAGQAVKRVRWRTVRNVEWTAAFLAVYSNPGGLLTRESQLFCIAARHHHNQMLSAGPDPFSFMPSNLTGAWARRMQVKNQICTEQSSTDDPEQDDSQKKTSCFSNIKIFLVSECALMLAQGTVGAYLVSFTGTAFVSTGTSYFNVPRVTSG